MRSFEYKLERAPFDLICDAAKAKTNREEKLVDALKLACIDVWDEPYVTPVTVIAAQGKVDAVNFLLSKGASYGFAGSGYASVGNDDAVNTLLGLIEHDPFQLNFFLKQTIYGYTFSKDPKKLEAFLHRIKKEFPDNYPTILAHLALGYAKNGKIKAAHDVFNITKEVYPDKTEEVLTALAEGLAYINNMPEIEKLFNEIDPKKDPRFTSAMINNMAFIVVSCLAERGMDAQIEPFLVFFMERFSHNVEKDVFLNAKALGHGQNRNEIAFEQTMDLYKEAYFAGLAEAGNKSVFEKTGEIILRGFARGGHVTEAYKFCKNKLDLITVIGGFADTGRIDAANVFLNKEETNRIWEKNDFLLNLIRALFCFYKNEEGGYLFFQKLKLAIEWDDEIECKKLTYQLESIVETLVESGCNKKINRFLRELKNIILNDLVIEEALRFLVKELVMDDRIKEALDVLESASIKFSSDLAEKLLLKSLIDIKHVIDVSSPQYYRDNITIIKILGRKINELTPEFHEALEGAGYNISELKRLANPFNRWTVDYKFTIPQATVWMEQDKQASLLILLLSSKIRQLGPDVSARIVLFLFGFAAEEMRNLSGKLQGMRTKHQGFFLPLKTRERLMIQEDASVCAKESDVSESKEESHLGKRRRGP